MVWVVLVLTGQNKTGEDNAKTNTGTLARRLVDSRNSGQAQCNRGVCGQVNKGVLVVNLYLISQSENEDYDTYDSAVVAAESENEAVKVHPSNYVKGNNGNSWLWSDGDVYDCDDWVPYLDAVNGAVKCRLIGRAVQGQHNSGEVICASFNAG